MAFYNGKAHVPLTTAKKMDREFEHIVMDAHAKDIPIDNIDDILSQLKKLLKSLDEYLCSRINILPIKVEPEN